MILNFLRFFKNYHQAHFLKWLANEQLQRQKTHLGMCDTQPKCILGQSSAPILTEYEIKNLGTLDSPLQNKKFRDHQWKNVTNLHNSNL